MTDGQTMRCSTCSAPIPAGNRFCIECGSPTATTPAPPAPAPPAPAEPRCATCGNPVDPSVVRFCVHCGSPLTGAAAPAAPSSVPYAAPSAPSYAAPAPTPPAAWPVDVPPAGPTPVGAPGRRRWRIAGVVLAVLALVAASIVVTLVVTGRDDEPTPASARDAGASSLAPAEEITPGSTGSAAPPSATASEEPPPVRCWDGTRADRVADCSEPVGARGLRWVFPSIDDADCGPETFTARRATLISCSDYLRDGTLIEFNYSEWTSFGAGAAHYAENADSEVSLPGGRIRWLIVSRDGDAKAALMYEGEVWSVSIYAPTPATRDRAVAGLLRMRPHDQLRGTAS